MRPIDAIRLVALAAIWGSSFLLIRIGLDDLTPFQIVFGRLVVGSLVLFGLLRYRKLTLPRGRQAWMDLCVMALIANIIPFTLITWGEQHISTSLTAILNSTTPLFTAVIAALFLQRDSQGPRRAIGILVGFAGVAVIVGLEPQGKVIGEIAVIVAAASYGVGFVYARLKLSGRHGSPLSLSTGQIILATALIAPVSLVDVTLQPPSLGILSMVAVVVLGAAGTGYAYVLFYRLISDVGATTASFVTYLIPIFGVALGAIFRGERLGANTFIGAALVIGGISLAESSRAATMPEPPESALLSE